MNITNPGQESPEMREMIRSLIEVIKESNGNVEQYNKSMKWMTLTLVVLTFFLAVIAVVQVRGALI